jgi:hypothetical protein
LLYYCLNWNNVKVRNPELSPFCGQLKLYADDGKKYLSDVINEEEDQRIKISESRVRLG